MNRELQKINIRASGGFTLVELMVSLTIFSIVMVISTGTLLIMIDINAKAQAIYSSTTNLTFSLDNITRELRTGHHYYCDTDPGEGIGLIGGTRDCPASEDANYIAFTRERDDKRTGFRLSGSSIEQKIDTGPWVPLTSEDVVVENFELVVDNTETYYPYPANGDTDQPVVDLFISGYVDNGLDNTTDFTIQSRIIQRRLDLI